MKSKVSIIVNLSNFAREIWNLGNEYQRNNYFMTMTNMNKSGTV